MNIVKKGCFLIILSLLLQGCVGAFVAGAAAGGAVAYEGRNYTQKQTDHNLVLSIQKQIYDDPALKDQCRIIIAAYDGVILMTGQAPSQELHDRAINIAKSTKGVKRVYDEIVVSGQISLLTQSSDTWLTTKVKSELLAAKGLNSSQIKVITENGVVYLMGVTTPKQAKIATNVARKISGVRKVVTLFEFQQ